MERILTALQMKKADEFTINNLGISSEILVENTSLKTHSFSIWHLIIDNVFL